MAWHRDTSYVAAWITWDLSVQNANHATDGLR